MRIAFFGTPELTTTILTELMKHNLTPYLIVTSEDKPQGRKMELTRSPAGVFADDFHIPLYQPAKLNEKCISGYGEEKVDLAEMFRREKIDLSIVVAYGKIIPESVITAPKFGTLNIHYSLLPKYRGASPVEAAILHGETETGVTIQQMVFKLDAGPILAQKTIAIADTETAPELLEKLNTAAVPMLIEIVKQFESGAPVPSAPQDDSLATSCTRIKKEDGELLATDTDEIKWHKYRAYFDWPGVFFFDKDNKRIKITRARYENKTFIIERVIPEGKKETDYKNF